MSEQKSSKVPTRKDLNYPDPLNGVRVMIEFQRPSSEVMVVNVTFMNRKSTPLTDFNSVPVVPDYVNVDASGFASNFLPGNNQGSLNQKVTMLNTQMSQGKPFKLQHLLDGVPDVTADEPAVVTLQLLRLTDLILLPSPRCARFFPLPAPLDPTRCSPPCSPRSTQLRLSFAEGGLHQQVSFEVPAVSSPANTFAGATEQPQKHQAKWAVDLMDR